MQHDVIVIGLGAMGTSAAYHLAKRGVRVLGLEQFDIPNALGSSHGATRMIRLAYYEHPDYVPLLRRAYQLWSELEQETKQRLMHVTGGLYLGPLEGGLVGGSLAAVRRHGLQHELLVPRELRTRFSDFHVPEDWVGLHEPHAGFLFAERVVTAQADAAMRRGAELHARETVIAFEANNERVAVTTTRGNYEAAHLVLCGGPWSASLVRDLRLNLRVTRQPMGWFWPRVPERFALGKFPVWAAENPDGSLFYGFPMVAHVPGIKVSHHGPEVETDPDDVQRDLLPGDEEQLHDALQRFLPDADGPLLAMRVCLYTNSPDRHFIIDRHPTEPRVTLACGFSGHGFKFASVVGEILADLAMQGSTQLPAQFLGLNRPPES